MWAIYYDDGSVLSGQGKPEKVDKFGVICIVQKVANEPRIIWAQLDFYYWNGEQWIGGDIFGVMDRLINDMPIQHFLQGRTIASVKYRDILAKADKETEGWI